MAKPWGDCCTCPQPACDTDTTGDTCATANCGFCLYGCPALDDKDCCGGAARLNRERTGE